jgi:hypothetical protein
MAEILSSMTGMRRLFRTILTLRWRRDVTIINEECDHGHRRGIGRTVACDQKK